MSFHNPPPALPEVGFIRQAQLIPAIVPFSNATLWRKVKDGSFPAPVKLSERVTAWKVDDIRAWIGGKYMAKPVEKTYKKTETSTSGPDQEQVTKDLWEIFHKSDDADAVRNAYTLLQEINAPICGQHDN